MPAANIPYDSTCPKLLTKSAGVVKMWQIVMVGDFIHIPVLLQEGIEALRVRSGGRYVDCTLGAGGHARAILRKGAPEGQLLGIDADPQAVRISEERLKLYCGRFIPVCDNFRNVRDICRRFDFCPVDGILFDLGMSTLQLEDQNRGFSFQRDSPLDMRFSPDGELTAADIVNTFSEGEVAGILRRYGEERRSRQIAREIIAHRPLKSTAELARIVSRVSGRGRIHPATRTFQALRMVVNKELENLGLALRGALDILGIGGRMVVIGFHSLEDRLVKDFLHREAQGCLGEQNPTLRLITKRAIRPSPAEVRFNARSRSARMRVAECIAPAGGILG
jgi:16S rRNA (cytosine1402-N4)-methyltransferase